MIRVDFGSADLRELRKAKEAWERMQILTNRNHTNVTYLSLSTGKPVEMDLEIAQKEWASICELVTLSILTRLEMM